MHPDASSWQAVFFDFDGVIADSTQVKIRAFATLFAAYGVAVQEAVVRYHLDNGGMPRQEKLRYCFTALAGQTPTEAALDQAGRTFSDLVLEEVVAAPLLAGALATLKRLKQAGIPTFVVSGTPGDEMRLIAVRKGLASLFTEVHGSPQAKPAIIADIVARHDLTPDRCLFVGDAMADYRAAEAHALHFLGIVPAGKNSIFPAHIPTSVHVTLDW
ncbi:MAG: HAD hydrolase-like protein [Desulfobulbus sp.]|jgi:phosphoglycolate phosphatase-like HAD superfamily hydrolase|uniref:HAD family hydrolase n=1 Tax=Desulfobulbus sp. TaxID=895 RepID=UPI00283AF210|nr:HAD family hydrolase [Desulfobulbus sp.]MDR2551063.1 HAD hydrolase-like protein [Desulfobulbus sp.]